MLNTLNWSPKGEAVTSCYPSITTDLKINLDPSLEMALTFFQEEGPRFSLVQAEGSRIKIVSGDHSRKFLCHGSWKIQV